MTMESPRSQRLGVGYFLRRARETAELLALDGGTELGKLLDCRVGLARDEQAIAELAVIARLDRLNAGGGFDLETLMLKRNRHQHSATMLAGRNHAEPFSAEVHDVAAFFLVDRRFDVEGHDRDAECLAILGPDIKRKMTQINQIR